MTDPAAAAFYFDVGSPYAYLAGERIERVLPCAVEWRPILLGGLFAAAGRGSWAQTPARAAGIADVEQRAGDRGLPPIRWPEIWPNDGLLAMRVAVVADVEGRGRRFALEAMRLQFREGTPLSRPEAVALAAERAGLDPARALQLAGDAGIKQQLRQRTEEAFALGVSGVPTVLLADGTVFWGDDRLEDAAAQVARYSRA